MFCVSAFLISPLFSSGLSLHASSALTPFSVPGIDLENIVYYKDDTHYFVMTAKKKSLLKKGVIKQVRTTHPKMCDSYWHQLKKKETNRRDENSDGGAPEKTICQSSFSAAWIFS